MVSMSEQGQAPAPEVVNWLVKACGIALPPRLVAPSHRHGVPGSRRELLDGTNVTVEPAVSNVVLPGHGGVARILDRDLGGAGLYGPVKGRRAQRLSPVPRWLRLQARQQ